jgi:hypothetical protein
MRNAVVVVVAITVSARCGRAIAEALRYRSERRAPANLAVIDTGGRAFEICTPSVRELPEDLGDFIAACRVVGSRPPVGGTPGIPPEGDSATVAPMTTSEVAAVLACSPRNVRGLRARGRLLARRHPRKGWLFDPVDVAAYIDERRRSA